MRIGTTSAMYLIVLSVAACGSLSESPTVPDARRSLSLPLEATVDSRFAGHATSAVRLAVRISANEIEVWDSKGIFEAGAYRLETFPSEPPAGGVAAGRRLLTRTMPPARLDEAMPCKLKPGVYNIIEAASGVTVGILIVYPNCRMEVFTG